MDAGWSESTARHRPDIIEAYLESLNTLHHMGKVKPRSEKHKGNGRQYRQNDPNQCLWDS
jgi:hypothetical protein